VIGVPDQKWGEVPRAILVLQDGAVLDEGALLAFAAERIARFKLPKSFQVVEALPKNPPARCCGGRSA